MSDPETHRIDYLWPAIGFAAGTGVVGALVLSTSIFERGIVGMVCGGLPFGLAGLWYAYYRARRPDSDSIRVGRPGYTRMSEGIRKIIGLTIRLGGESHQGWLPAGAAVPLPTPVRDVVVDLEIQFDGSGYLLICSAQDGSFTWDSWHQDLHEAQSEARDSYGVEPAQWIDA